MPALDYSVPGVYLPITVGPVFLAHCFNWCLFGVLALQVYLYYVSFPKDPRYTKVLVYGVFVIDSISMALATHSGWVILVQNWGNVDVFQHLGFSWASVPVSSGLVAMIVHCFFAWRIWKLSHSIYMPIFIVLVTCTQAAFAFAAAHIVSVLQNFHYIRKLVPSIWLGGGMLADILVSGTLVTILLRTPTGFQITDRLIMRLVRISIETAAVTTIAAAIKLAMIFSYHDNKHLVFCLLLARLYSNTLLATLNSRSQIFGGDSSVGAGSGNTRMLSNSSSGNNLWRRSDPTSSFGSHQKSFLSEKVTITCEMETDQPATPTEYHINLNKNPNSPVTPNDTKPLQPRIDV